MQENNQRLGLSAESGQRGTGSERSSSGSEASSSMKKAIAFRSAIFVSGVALGVVLSFALFMFWIEHYPWDYDPKNIDYVLWKYGHNPNMNLDDALSGMTHDTWAVNRVKGLDKAQLTERFGSLKGLTEARPYDQRCYAEASKMTALYAPSPSKEIVFLRESDWMVLLQDGKASNIVLCKGF